MTQRLPILLFFTINLILTLPLESLGKPQDDDQGTLEDQIAELRELQRRQGVAVEGKFKKLQIVDEKLSKATIEIAGLKEQIATLLAKINTKSESESSKDIIQEAVKNAITPLEELLNCLLNSIIWKLLQMVTKKILKKCKVHI
jgi:tRNA A37 threonylcarbamoyltransferase TsaD